MVKPKSCLSRIKKYFKKSKKKKNLIKKLKLSAIFFVLLVLAIALFLVYRYYNNPSRLTETNKQEIISYCFNYLKRANNSKKLNLPKFDYDKVRVVLYKNGKLISAKTGTKNKKTKDRLHQDLDEALGKILKDKTYESIKSSDLSNSVVLVEFIYNPRKADKDLKTAEQNLEIGVNAVKLTTGGQSHYSYASDQIVYHQSVKNIFEYLCGNAKQSKDCYKQAEITSYKTLSFEASEGQNISDLYRMNNLIKTKDINQETLKNSLNLTTKWYKNNLNQNNLIAYAYDPVKDQYSKDNNHIRQLATAWAMAEVEKEVNGNYPQELIRNYLDYYLKYKQTKDDYAYLSFEDGDAKLAYNAFVIQLLLVSDYSGKNELLKQFAKGIVTLQEPNGSYKTDFLSDKKVGVDYYPGEAMLALMNLYTATKNQYYLNSVDKAFPYYKDYWEKNKNLAFIPWQTQAYYLLYKETKNQDLASFIFEMTNWSIDNYQITKTLFPDELGGFPPKNPSSATSVYLEGFNDAYALAKDINNVKLKNKYLESIKIGIGYILQTQYNQNNSFWMPSPQKVIGGFRNSPDKNDLRDDMTQHASRAILKAYKNEIFNQISS